MELKTFGMGAMTILAVVFSACTANDELDEFTASSTDNNVIGFLVQTSNPTRSAGSYSNGSNFTNFKVTALDGDANYFGDMPDFVSSHDNGNSWSSDNLHYWPSNRPDSWKGLSFYAYVDGRSLLRSAAAEDCFELTDNVASFKDFEVNANPAQQTDLMYAVAKDVKKNSFSGKVNLCFRHALSQITFTAQNNHPLYEEIEILSVEVGGIKGKGTYLFSEISTSSSASDFYRNSELSKGVWSVDKDTDDRVYILDNLNVKIGAPDANGVGKTVDLNASSAEGSRAADSSTCMYLIPQKVAAKADVAAQEGAYIKVTVRMTPTYAPEQPQTSEKVLPINVDWKEGRSYNYNIVWNPVPITFSVSVDGYDEVTVNQN